MKINDVFKAHPEADQVFTVGNMPFVDHKAAETFARSAGKKVEVHDRPGKSAKASEPKKAEGKEETKAKASEPKKAEGKEETKAKASEPKKAEGKEETKAKASEPKKK